jgi:hypothetical protein
MLAKALRTLSGVFVMLVWCACSRSLRGQFGVVVFALVKLRPAAPCFGKPGESGPGVLESLRHSDEAICAEGCYKAGASLVFLLHVYLVVTGETVEE